MPRWLKFNAVGAVGAAVQLGMLALLVRLGVHYLVATALAVETAVLQNYYWHARWTWKGRDGSLWRFHLANGLVSVLSNLMWMRIFTGWLGIPPIPANLMAIALTSVANFLFGDRWVFQRPSVRRTPSLESKPARSGG
ncbi:MAG TPA: GtrA family protein [Bryobacteraceae bacterium]|jgi:putative flippase GtrA|nr:GtrA family protein [Bryobacteraceae bacterium]